jgi:Ser/Thr protein kinase RdoA (MazF antagonist)
MRAMHSTAHPYDALDPQAVLDALSSVGLHGDGRLLQLNSYENRVFQVFLEDGRAVVAKFYRPGRWSDEQILEEHAFAEELAQQEVPLVPPLRLDNGLTLAQVQLAGTRHRFSVSERRAGRAPELDHPDTLRWIGRFIGRLHAVGAQRAFEHRRRMDVATFGEQPLQWLLKAEAVPPAQLPAWQQAVEQALALAREAFETARNVAQIRLHGDCHPGNLLWREADGPHFVDLDDAVTGPAVQDLWMLLAGDSDSATPQLAWLLEGYEAFMRFDRRQLALIEPLRTLRMLHHSAWLAERWSDPAFPPAFPWFGTPAYWQQQTTQMREQVEAMQQPPLAA